MSAMNFLDLFQTETHLSICNLQTCLTHISLLPCLAPARPTTLSKNDLEEEDDLFGQLLQPTVATNGEREIEETQWSFYVVSCALHLDLLPLPTQ